MDAFTNLSWFPIGAVLALLGLTGFFGWRYREMKRRIAALETGERIPVKCSVKHEFQIGYWTDPEDGQRKQIWIPKIWLEYEDGSTKPLDIDGLCEKQGIKRFPFPISFDESVEEK